MIIAPRQSGFYLVLILCVTSLVGMSLVHLTSALAEEEVSLDEGWPARGQADRGVQVSDARPVGEEIYDRCLACHAIEYDRVGPRHCGLFGRPAGSVVGFAYSDAMRESGIIWNRETLDQFLNSPLDFVPGTLMTYAGVPDAGDRAKLIAWLEISTAPDRCRPSGS